LMAVQYLPLFLILYLYYGQRHTEHRATGWYVRAECILPTAAAKACLMDAMVIECRIGTCCVFVQEGETLKLIALSLLVREKCRGFHMRFPKLRSPPRACQIHRCCKHPPLPSLS
jgi:hypothetical protein